MEFVAHEGRETAYRIADRGGASPTFVCVHGSGGDHRVWKAQDRLARQHPIVSLDLSGHGASDDIETEAGAATLNAYARDVQAVMDAVDGDILIGNSLGGAVIQWGVVTDVLEPAAMVLVGTGAKLAVREDLRGWLTEDFDRAVDFLHGDDRLFAGDDRRLIEASRTAMRACGRRVTERDYLTCHRFDVRDQLRAIEMPTLAICGSRDALTPPVYHEYLAENLPKGVLSIIDDAAHLVMLERPDRFNTAVVAFVDHVGATGDGS